MPTSPLAVIDIGSNSGRVIVIRLTAGGHLEILSEARTPLRLMSDVDADGSLSEAAYERTLTALEDFMAVTAGAGARRTVAVATAAVREAANATDFVTRLEDATGLSIRVIDGDEEARLAFNGAVFGLPVEDGMLVDVGGGSLEIAHFRHRRLLRNWTLPLGALRLTDTMLRNDPPKQGEIAALQQHVLRVLAQANVPPLLDDERVVGTGGTVRNLAKLHRATTPYAIHRLHGYTLSRKGLREVVSRVTTRRLARRAALPGLSGDRADSIVGGALVVQTVVDALHGSEVLVSGQGLREGLAYETLADVLPSLTAVRRASVTAITSRFTSWDADRSRRRARLVTVLADVMMPAAPAELVQALELAATLLDVGRSVEYYRRWDHAAEIVISADLHGFSHQTIALVASLILRAGKSRATPDAYSDILESATLRGLNRASALLALADEVERRMRRGTVVSVSRRDSSRSIVLTLPLSSGTVPADLTARLLRAFGRELVLETLNGEALEAVGLR